MAVVARDVASDDEARAHAAAETLRALHSREADDPFEVLREDLRKRLGRPRPGRRVTRDLLHLAEAVTALAAEAEATAQLLDY